MLGFDIMVFQICKPLSFSSSLMVIKWTRYIQNVILFRKIFLKTPNVYIRYRLRKSNIAPSTSFYIESLYKLTSMISHTFPRTVITTIPRYIKVLCFFLVHVYYSVAFFLCALPSATIVRSSSRLRTPRASTRRRAHQDDAITARGCNVCIKLRQ